MKNSIAALIMLIITFSCCKDKPIENGFTPFSWKTSTPAEQGLNQDIIDSAFISATQKGYVDGLLIIRNGYLLREEYYNGYNESTPHNIKSVSKGFISAMSGIALRDNMISSLDEKIMEYFPEFVYPGIDERKFNITLRHLLTMRMGIDGEENNLMDVMLTEDWIKTTIELPLLYSPGEKFRYNTLQTHLLAAIITRASGMNLFDYTSSHLTNPMGIDIDEWYTDPQGYYRGGWDMFMTPREMAVLGYLWLNGGKLNGIQIVPSEWVDATLTKSLINDSPQWGVLTDYNYGYLWWLGKINGYDMFWALGYGGQMVITFPSLNLIVVTTAGYEIGWEVDQERPILEIVSKYILPAVL